MPSPGFFEVSLLTGLDAPTGNKAKNQPSPLALRVQDLAWLPNENHIRSLHALAVADARDSALLEADLRGEDIRREYLGQYAQGQKAPAVRTPPVIMETYILPYQTEFGTLAGERTLWITVEDAEWVWPDRAASKARNEIGSTVRGR